MVKWRKSGIITVIIIVASPVIILHESNKNYDTVVGIWRHDLLNMRVQGHNNFYFLTHQIWVLKLCSNVILTNKHIGFFSL